MTTVCHRCSKKIAVDKEKYVLLGTYNMNKDNHEELFFHFPCWIDYFNDKIVARIAVGQKNALKVLKHMRFKYE